MKRHNILIKSRSFGRMRPFWLDSGIEIDWSIEEKDKIIFLCQNKNQAEIYRKHMKRNKRKKYEIIITGGKNE